GNRPAPGFGTIKNLCCCSPLGVMGWDSARLGFEILHAGHIAGMSDAGECSRIKGAGGPSCGGLTAPELNEATPGVAEASEVDVVQSPLLVGAPRKFYRGPGRQGGGRSGTTPGPR